MESNIIKVETVLPDVVLLHNFWDAATCENFIAQSEEIGFDAAKVETDLGQRIVSSVRNNERVMYKDKPLAEKLWSRLFPFAVAKTGNSVATGLNEMIRVYKYSPGQLFKRHRDQSFIRNENEASFYTLMIYLNDNFEGGETIFERTVVKPKQGTALLFLHSTEHEGSEVKKGTKYVLRTDVMYRLPTE